MIRWRIASAVAVTLLVGLVVVPGPVSAETLYAKTDGVKLTETESPMSRVVASLELGDPVQVVAKSGRHYKVRAPSGKVGWVFKFKLTDKAVERRGGGGGLSALTGESRIAAREARAGGSIRGLKEVSERYRQDQNIDPAHEEAVERMEQRAISRDQLMEFQRQGSIGEFAGG